MYTGNERSQKSAVTIDRQGIAVHDFPPYSEYSAKSEPIGDHWPVSKTRFFWMILGAKTLLCAIVTYSVDISG